MPQNDDKFILILDKLSDIGERSARMEANQDNMKEDLEEVKRQDVHQNQLLAEHIKGVETAQLRLDNEILARRSIESIQADLKSRVEKLEEPKKIITALKNITLYAAAIGGLILAYLKWYYR
jgi:hypothetical protein